jgi:hypothetical protein
MEQAFGASLLSYVHDNRATDESLAKIILK